MTDSNPFVLPGMGQNSELSGNPLLASMEMMRQAWAGLAGPGGLGQSLPLTPPLNLEELERRIAELRTVEGWLRLNLQMLSSTIQGMEVQRATIATLRSFVGSVSGMPSAAEGEASPLEVALGLKPGRAEDKPAAPQAAAPQAAADPVPPAPDRVNEAAQSASQAWWDLLNQQFSQIAAATAASLPAMMPGMEAVEAKPAAAKTAKAGKAPAAAKKAAPRKTAKSDPSKPAAAPRGARAASKVVRKSTRAG
ncbi:transcriptional regulator [Bordetella hinzii]|uniref:PhaM family polyhydroxyalkanoate granule multifunctional regulatory protein n=1 Tax=Bordetella hinzii TaxID=103855 RepID=UPI0013EFC4F5|nr:PhaM family polyhydroxyalkanoate granule multifunctional regulatory protein [Bordetella hinzii]QII87262.1 transcriptional regulator [Bordetella hinzii]